MIPGPKKQGCVYVCPVEMYHVSLDAGPQYLLHADGMGILEAPALAPALPSDAVGFDNVEVAGYQYCILAVPRESPLLNKMPSKASSKGSTSGP
jgi:hypothetical protein